MKISIQHQLQYSYSRPVFFEPLTIRLRPRTDASQTLLDHKIEILPKPTGMTRNTELDGNDVTSVWFDSLHSQLTISVSSTASTLRANPYDFILQDSAYAKVPLRYKPEQAALLHTYRTPSRESPEASRYARHVADGCGRGTLDFLFELAKRIHEDIRWMVRETGEPMRPAEVLAKREGACRDVAVLYIECCRTMGLAARFVSGYHCGEDDPEPRHLHAWVEVYIPGGGWRAYDPTHGLAVDDSYVAVASGARPSVAAPTTGTFRGTGVESEFSFQLAVEKVGE